MHTAVRLADLADARDRDHLARLVAEHPAATPFHRLEWIEAVARATGQTALALIGPDAALPLVLVHSPLFGRALVASGFGVGGGVLAPDARSAATMHEAAMMLANRLSCRTLELRGGWLPANAMPGWRRDAGTYLGFARPLADDDDAELLAIPRKQRAEVRRALGFGLTVDFGDAEAHYRIYAESVHHLGTPVFPRALFRAVLDAFGTDAEVLTVRRDGQALASVLSLYHRGTVMPYWGGGTAAARAWRANDAMYYALMCHARTRGATHFDFGRSKAGTGPASFKKNWGFEGVPLAYASWSIDGHHRVTDPRDPGVARKVALWKRLPRPLANALGPWIARGLG